MRYFVSIAVILLLLTLAAVIVCCYPKQSVLAQWCNGHYRGFGFTDEPNVFGKLYFQVDTVLTLPEDGWCSIACNGGNGTFPFVANYPNGRIRAKGRCTLSRDAVGQPTDIGDIVDGVFRNPNGTVSSEVHGGTGTETYWTCSGTKVGEVERVDSRTTMVTAWHRNGNFHYVTHYKDGKRQGAVDYYASDGSKTMTIVFEGGIEVERHQAQPQERIK